MPLRRHRTMPLLPLCPGPHFFLPLRVATLPLQLSCCAQAPTRAHFCLPGTARSLSRLRQEARHLLSICSTLARHCSPAPLAAPCLSCLLSPAVSAVLQELFVRACVHDELPVH